MSAIIGCDRKIDREWLDALLDRVAVDFDVASLRAFLRKSLRSRNLGKTACRKSITVLMRIWFFVPPEHQAIRKDALGLLPAIPSQDRIWLHWGMTLLAYPVFRDTAAAIGRFLTLHGNFTLLQLQRRLIQSWGDRSTLKRASQRIVRSMVQWGVLADADVRGRFVPTVKHKTDCKALQLWFLEASQIAASASELESRQLINLPTSFPFDINVGLSDLRQSDHFIVHRQGLDMDMVSVRVGILASPEPPREGKFCRSELAGVSEEDDTMRE